MVNRNNIGYIDIIFTRIRHKGKFMVETAVFYVIASQLHRKPQDILLDMSLRDLGIDSLGAITILYELEDQFDIEIPNEVFDSLETVNDIVIKLQQIIDNKNPA
jgi:acyl carrier protein